MKRQGAPGQEGKIQGHRCTKGNSREERTFLSLYLNHPAVSFTDGGNGCLRKLNVRYRVGR